MVDSLRSLKRATPLTVESTTVLRASRWAVAACRRCMARAATQRLTAGFYIQQKELRVLPESSEYEASRRSFLVAALLASAPQALLVGSAAAEDEDLVEYTDAKGSYSLLRPKAWEQTEKAGADALFKAPNLRSTDLGITISPIRIKNLDQLGDMAAIGRRLLTAERSKESTKSAELLAQTSQTGASGTTFLLFDYTVSTTRGDKRILSKVAVASGNLYIVNGSIKCEAESCKADSSLVGLIQRSIHSFDLKTA